MTESEETNRIVVCFDRDWTVSVNPHPEREAVPLSWVRHLAHDAPGVDVWATGNQMLSIEASIHGTTHAAVVWVSLFDEKIEPIYPNERVEYFKPARDDRLRLIQDCYEYFHDREDLTLIVVDDADLAAMEDEGWHYYTAWEFVPAALDGEFDFFDPESMESSSTELSVDHRYSLDEMDESVSLPKPPEHLRNQYEGHYEQMSEVVEKMVRRSEQDWTPEEQRVIDWIAERSGEEFAEENASLILAQAELVGEIGTETEE
ncbi:MAG TPA: hypothetical protein VFJ06_11525 [Halococcus sp.]|nr:hypothetical protein [Halococcus sp.]